MRNEDFELFIEEFGEATTSGFVPETEIEKWQGKLPTRLLEYWRDEGRSSYYNGLFTLVDPDDYEATLDEWLENSYLEEIDIFHAIAIDGFGGLYLCGENSGQSVAISPIHNTLFVQIKDISTEQSERSLNISIESLFGSATLDYYNKGGFFEKAVKKLGPLGKNEIFGFEPALILGGEFDIKCIQKVDARVHLSILAQLAPVEINEINI